MWTARLDKIESQRLKRRGEKRIEAKRGSETRVAAYNAEYIEQRQDPEAGVRKQRRRGSAHVGRRRLKQITEVHRS